jgi:proteasome lid subunit RPN8/RPN11
MDYGTFDALIIQQTKRLVSVTMENGLFIKQQHYKSMLEDVSNRVPNEACGLVAGLNGCSERVYIMKNILNSPFRFRMEPEEQLRAFYEIENLDLELLAIYHSHPRGPAKPSETDIVEYSYPGTKYLIWSRKGHEWICRGYTIADQRVVEVPLMILDNE